MIIHIYTKYPPKNKVEIPAIETLKSLSNKEFAKYLQKFPIFQYHPDKNRKYDDKKWVVLCDEITKYLNDLVSDLC